MPPATPGRTGRAARGRRLPVMDQHAPDDLDSLAGVMGDMAVMRRYLVAPIEQVGTPEDHVAFLRAEREQIPRLLESRIQGAPWNRPERPADPS